MQEVIPGLYLGGLMASKSFLTLDKVGITHIVNASGHGGLSNFTWGGRRRSVLVVDVDVGVGVAVVLVLEVNADVDVVVVVVIVPEVMWMLMW